MNLRLLLLLALGVARASAADAPVPTIPAAKPAAAAPAPRNDSSVAPSASFDTFRLVNDRNIFNAYRTGRRDRSAEDQAPRFDTIALVGTMDSDKGLRAFFDGSESAYRKALHVGESVGPFKVTRIEPNVVALERDGKSLPMRVAQQLRRPEGGDWNLVGEDVLRREAQASAAAAATANTPPAIPADASDALRKLMEARQKQLKQ